VPDGMYSSQPRGVSRTTTMALAMAMLAELECTARACRDVP
jgi:hypothetical protein